ncbi:MAG TPA: amidohydrolase family protein [Thermomicrobiales bacterium]|nr:amidohydrolase family protein [Thermomicrobiales bacterium]
MTRTKVRGRWVIASDGHSHHILENGEVVYEGNTIVYTGHAYPGPVDETIDAGDAVIGPGFVDLDALFDLDTTILGFDNAPGWKKGRVWPTTYLERGPRDVYTPDEEAFQHEYAMVQLLRHGVTTALPIRSIFYRKHAETYDENARAAEAAARLGIRMYLGPSYRTGLTTVSPDGTFGQAWEIEEGVRGLDEAIRFVQDFDGAHGGLIRGFLQPDRIEGCTEDLLLRTAAAGRELGCPVRLHCCQGEMEVAIVQERWGKSSIELLHDLDFLTDRTLLPHGTNMGGAEPTRERVDRELGWIVEAGSTIVHCPLVSLRHGSILDSFQRYRELGVSIGLGTDTWPPDLIQNMHVGVMGARAVDSGRPVSAADYYTAATIGGADALGRPDLGRLMPGALADFTIFDLTGDHLGQFIDPIQTMVLSGTGRDITTVIVDGRVVMRDRELPGVDIDAMRLRAQDQFGRLIATYPERSHLHPPVEEIFSPSFPIRRPGTAGAR